MSVSGDSRPKRGGMTVRKLNTALYGSEAGAQNLSVGEAKRRMFATQLARVDMPLSLRIGRVATVERSEAEARGRAIFAQVLYALVPESTTRLANPNALEVERTYQGAHDEALDAAASDPTLAEMPYSVAALASESEPFAVVLAAKWAVIEPWQRRFQLDDDWLADLAWRTMHTAWEMREVGLEYRAPLGLGTLGRRVPDLESAASTTGREVVFEWGRPVYPVFLDDLKLTPDDARFDMYDPNTEDLDTATNRLLEALRPRVRAAVEAIVADHRELSNVVAPVRFRSVTAFEWLVRYQVLGESKSAIANAEGKDRSHVVREVNRAAKLIGLTLRESRGGRPRRKHANIPKPVR